MFRIYVGNLNYRTTEDILRDAFGQYGQVSQVMIMTDRETGRPRGFAFVEMDNDEEGRRAIEGMNGQEMEGRTLTVNEARPRTPGGGGGGEGRGGGGGYRGGGGGGGYRGSRDRE